MSYTREEKITKWVQEGYTLEEADQKYKEWLAKYKEAQRGR